MAPAKSKVKKTAKKLVRRKAAPKKKPAPKKSAPLALFSWSDSEEE